MQTDEQGAVVRDYAPVFPGIHVCGADHEENEFFTVLNIPAASDTEARRMWEAAKAIAEVPEDEADFCVDLNTSDGHLDDFWSNRQMLAAIRAINGENDAPVS